LPFPLKLFFIDEQYSSDVLFVGFQFCLLDLQSSLGKQLDLESQLFFGFQFHFQGLHSFGWLPVADLDACWLREEQDLVVGFPDLQSFC